MSSINLPKPDLILCHKIYLESLFTYKLLLLSLVMGTYRDIFPAHTCLVLSTGATYSPSKREPPSVSLIVDDSAPDHSLLAQRCSSLPCWDSDVFYS